MKTKLVVVFSLLFVLIYFNGCGDNSVNIIEKDPNKEITINRNDFVYDAMAVHRECLVKVGGVIHTQPYGVNAVSISKDKNIIFSFDITGYMIKITNDSNLFDFFDFKVLEKPFVAHNVNNVVFSPYDNNLAIILIEEEKFGPGSYRNYNWYYYTIDTKKMQKLDLDSIIHKEFVNNPNMLRWLNTSTPGNDKFFFDNNTILSYPSGSIEPNPSGLQISENEKVVSVSPDMQKFFTVKENELYLNGRKVPSSEFVYWENVPINWSDDSKYFLGVGIEENKYAQLNIIYRMEPGTHSSFKMHRIIDITRNFCSYQSPSGFGYHRYSQAVFKSESSIAMTLFPDLRDRGDLCEIGFNGELIRKLTNKYP